MASETWIWTGNCEFGTHPSRQRPEGGVGDLLDVLGAAGQAGLLTVGVEGEAELGGDDHPVADGFEGFADQLFVDERPVHLGGVEKGDAPLDRRAQQRDVRGPVRAGTTTTANDAKVRAPRRRCAR